MMADIIQTSAQKGGVCLGVCVCVWGGGGGRRFHGFISLPVLMFYFSYLDGHSSCFNESSFRQPAKTLFLQF